MTAPLFAVVFMLIVVVVREVKMTRRQRWILAASVAVAFIAGLTVTLAAQ